jgi:O-antigen/teichoic acid export membrane protein
MEAGTDAPSGPGARQRAPRGSPAASLRRHLQDPLSRNGYFLIANSAVTGALGLVYWLLMARLYPTVDVGRASALYAAMNLLAALTAFNFNGVLIRFVPLAGRHTARFVMLAYALSIVATVVFTAAFLLRVRWFGGSYSVLGGPVLGALFVAAVVAWALFTLQDSVLVGLRSADWVLAENGAFGVVKIVLLVALVSALPHHAAIYVSWMLPVVVAVPLVNALIFRRLLPQRARGDGEFFRMRDVRRFVAGDYPGAMFLLATGGLVPVIVAARVGAQQVAFFYMAWVVASMLDMIGLNMAMSLTVEGGADPARLADHYRQALRKMVILLLPCVALVVLLAPWGLRLFGPGYAAHGAPVLQLLALASVPRAAVELYLGALRALSRTALVAAVQGVRAVLILALVLGLTGTTGAALAMGISQGVVAVIFAVGMWRMITGDRGPQVVVTGRIEA